MSSSFQRIRNVLSGQGLSNLIPININATELISSFNPLAPRKTNPSNPISNQNHQHLGNSHHFSDSNRVFFSDSDSDPTMTLDLHSSNFSDLIFGFITSRYCLSLFIIAFLSNRIRHICRPNGRPRPINGNLRLSILLPSLLSLSYVTFRFIQELSLSARLGQLESTPTGSLVALEQVERLQLGKQDGVLFFRALLASGLSIITETLLRSLEASHSEQSSFNLFSWALLLHQSLSLGLSPSSPSAASNLKAAKSAYRPSLLSRLSGSAVRVKSNPVPSSSNTSFLTSRTQLFLHLTIVLSEILVLNVLDIFSKRNSKFRLPTSTFFASLGIFQYLWNLTHYQRFSFDWSMSRFWELSVVALIVITAGLNLLTQFILVRDEGSSSRRFNIFPLNRMFQIDYSRIFFHPTNFPSLYDDFNTALFKLGASCLKTTRMNGMQNEIIEVKTFEANYVEIDWKDGIGDQAQVMGENRNGNGLQNEIKEIRGVGFHDSNREDSNDWLNSSITAVFSNPSRISSIESFFVEIYRLVKSVGVYLYQGFLDLQPVRKILRSDHAYRFRRSMSRFFKWCRLLWHGTRGERERELRIESRRLIKEKEALEQRKRMLQSKIEERMRRAENQGGTSFSLGDDTMEEIADYNEEDDEDWEENDSDEGENELEDEGRGRERLFSPTPGPEDFEEEPDSRSLLQLARFEFDSSNGVNEHDGIQGRNRFETHQGVVSSSSTQLTRSQTQDRDHSGFEAISNGNSNNDFPDIFFAHLSNPTNLPMTRRNYQKTLNQISNQSSASSSANTMTKNVLYNTAASSQSSINSQQLSERNRRLIEEEQRRDLIEVMRARRIPINGTSDSSGSLDFEKERLRTCVVCIEQERTILLWPCRCLALCEGCRDSLASRPTSNSLSGGTIICPCCRSPIQGYSRLFLP